MNNMKDRWEDKLLHGKYTNSLSKPNIDQNITLIATRRGLKEGFVIAEQKQSLSTRNSLKIDLIPHVEFLENSQIQLTKLFFTAYTSLKRSTSLDMAN